MGRLVMFNMVTLDGRFAGPAGELEWHNVDREFVDFAVEQLDTAGLLVFGRKTYELMASFWPSELAYREDPETAKRMNALPKLVVSRGLPAVEWGGTRLLREVRAADFERLKKETKGLVFLFGSAELSRPLVELGLVDEFRLMLNPLVLGSGLPLFEPGRRLELKLLSSRSFANGNLLLCYQPRRATAE